VRAVLPSFTIQSQHSVCWMYDLGTVSYDSMYDLHVYVYDIDTDESTRGVDFMYGCIYTAAYSLTRSLTVSYDRLQVRAYTDMTRIRASFCCFKNHTRLTRIHSNGPSVTRIRPRGWFVCMYG